MEPIELWRWIITSETTGKRVKTRHRMTEADALAMDPTAEKVPGSLEVRRPGGNTSDWQRGDAPIGER
jgi:hypothetical protein